MSTDLATIVSLYDSRRMSLGRIYERAREIEEIANGDFVIPLPELDENEKPAVPNLIVQGIDQHGMRIASTIPDIYFEPLRPLIKKSQDLARDRKKATLGLWEHNEIDIKLHRRARWFITYASSPVIITPDTKLGVATWNLRKPLHSFPAPTVNPDDMTPDDCIFDFSRPFGWIEDNYPDQARMLKRQRGVDRDDLFTCLEYVDAEEKVLAVIGDRSAGRPRNLIDHRDPTRIYGKSMGSSLVLPGHMRGGSWQGTEDALILERAPNYARVCTAVVPGRITLDEPMGQFDSMVGLFQMQAKLMALEVNAVTRGVFPDQWLVARQGETAEIIKYADGLAGEVGEVRGGDIKSMNENPGYQTYPTLSYLERASRQNALIPAEFGGESPTQVRTGRRGDAIMSAVVDFPTQEAQMVFARALKHETKRAIAVMKGYFGNRKLSFFVSWKGAKGKVDYSPNEIFEDDGESMMVKYAYPGTDLNGQTIRVGQKLGIGLLSTQTAREQDPEIEDAELEHDRIISESLERAQLASLEQAITAQQMSPVEIARIRKVVRENRMELDEAVLQVHEEAQQRQAPNVEPVDAGDPAAQPGIAAPGMGEEAGAAIPDPNVSQERLNQLLGQLRTIRTSTNAGVT